MMKVKIQANHRYRFTIPVPYCVLRISSSILTSKFLWSQVNKWMNHQGEKPEGVKPAYSFIPPNPKALKHSLHALIKELKHQKGLVIVDIQSADGTQVRIQL